MKNILSFLKETLLAKREGCEAGLQGSVSINPYSDPFSDAPINEWTVMIYINVTKLLTSNGSYSSQIQIPPLLPTLVSLSLSRSFSSSRSIASVFSILILWVFSTRSAMEGTILNFLIDLCLFRFVFLIRNETITLIICGFLVRSTSRNLQRWWFAVRIEGIFCWRSRSRRW